MFLIVIVFAYSRSVFFSTVNFSFSPAAVPFVIWYSSGMYAKVRLEPKIKAVQLHEQYIHKTLKTLK